MDLITRLNCYIFLTFLSNPKKISLFQVYQHPVIDYNSLVKRIFGIRTSNKVGGALLPHERRLLRNVSDGDKKSHLIRASPTPHLMLCAFEDRGLLVLRSRTSISFISNPSYSVSEASLLLPEYLLALLLLYSHKSLLPYTQAHHNNALLPLHHPLLPPQTPVLFFHKHLVP